jgi:hypothetical protein
MGPPGWFGGRILLIKCVIKNNILKLNVQGNCPWMSWLARQRLDYDGEDFYETILIKKIIGALEPGSNWSNLLPAARASLSGWTVETVNLETALRQDGADQHRHAGDQIE